MRATLAAFGIFAAMASGQAAGEDAHHLYRLRCSGCHGLEGMGSKVGRVPPFPGLVARFLGEPEGRAFLVLVPGVANSDLSDDQAAGVLNYVLDAWGDGAHFKPYDSMEVREIRKTKVDDIAALRARIAEKLARRGVSIAY